MKRAIYTAIIGKYDTLKEPTVVTRGWDYICVTDNHNLHSKVWQMVYVNKSKYGQLKAREIKILFYIYLRGYDISIWVDGSIQVRCDLNGFYLQYNNNVELVAMKHPHRNSLSEEVSACIRRKKTTPALAMHQLDSYIKRGYKEKNDLAATGLLIRKHTPKVRVFCQKWFNEVSKHTVRDQLSFPFVLWLYPVKHNLIPFDVVSNNNLFLLKDHNYKTIAQ